MMVLILPVNRTFTTSCTCSFCFQIYFSGLPFPWWKTTNPINILNEAEPSAISAHYCFLMVYEQLPNYQLQPSSAPPTQNTCILRTLCHMTESGCIPQILGFLVFRKGFFFKSLLTFLLEYLSAACPHLPAVSVLPFSGPSLCLLSNAQVLSGSHALPALPTPGRFDRMGAPR